ncbi:MAG: hypothetical protein WCK58_15730 [Chloroflexota bacterium]
MTMKSGTSDHLAEAQRRLATVAALFWFEAIGAMVVAGYLLLAPMSCMGDGGGPCPGVLTDAFRDGSLAVVLLFMAGAAAAVTAGWAGTQGRPGARALAFSFVGALGAAPVVLAAATDGMAAWLPLLWSGIPAVLLLGTWVPVVARTGRSSLAAD